MADVNPQTTFHVAFTEREFNVVMLALATLGGGTAKPDGRHRADAAELNKQLLLVAKRTFEERVVTLDKKLERAPLTEAEQAEQAEKGLTST